MQRVKMNGISIVKEISRTPDSSYFNAHYFCDYIELLALINNTDIISTSNVYDRFLEDEKINEVGEEGSSEADEAWESRIDEWFTLLEVRQNEFGNLYPFLINKNTIKLLASLDDSNNTYIFLLLNSMRRYISDKNLLTTDFERISHLVLKNYLPDFAQTFQFGKSNISYDRYTGHITNKIDILAQDLKCQTTYKPHFFSSSNNGDGGLDIVAWVPFTNDLNQCNIQVYLGQCATGKDWLDKQDDTHKFPNKYIKFDGFVNYIMFIPYDGRNLKRKFFEEAKMDNYLFFDRFRLLKMIDDYSFIKTLPSFATIVQKVIDYEEDII